MWNKIQKIYIHTKNTTRNLPAEYQEVEYIEWSWTQWIDTGVTATQNTMSQIKFRNLSSNWAVIYWYCKDNDNADYRLFSASNIMYFDFGSSRISGSHLYTGTDYELELWNYYVKNVWASTNILTWTTISSYTSAWTIKLSYHDNNIISSDRWYYVKIRDWATQIRDLVPCYRIADSVIWMYDVVNDQFYTNSWSWTFTKGSDIPATIEHLVRPQSQPSVLFEYWDWSSSQWTESSSWTQWTITKTASYITFYRGGWYCENYMSWDAIDWTKNFLLEFNGNIPNTSVGYHWAGLKWDETLTFFTNWESPNYWKICCWTYKETNPWTVDYFIKKEWTVLTMGRWWVTKYTDNNYTFSNTYYLYEQVYNDTLTINTAKLTYL